jgi:hypothetical protein
MATSINSRNSNHATFPSPFKSITRRSSRVNSACESNFVLRYLTPCLSMIQWAKYVRQCPVTAQARGMNIIARNRSSCECGLQKDVGH